MMIEPLGFVAAVRSRVCSIPYQSRVPDRLGFNAAWRVRTSFWRKLTRRSRLHGAGRPQHAGRRARARHGATGNAVIAAGDLDAAKKRAQKLEAKGKAVKFDELLRMEP